MILSGENSLTDYIFFFKKWLLLGLYSESENYRSSNGSWNYLIFMWRLIQILSWCVGSDWTSHFTVGGFAFSIYFLAFKRENGRGSLEKKKRRISHDLFSCKIASSMEEWRNVCRLAFINIPSLILKCNEAKTFMKSPH